MLIDRVLVGTQAVSRELIDKTLQAIEQRCPVTAAALRKGAGRAKVSDVTAGEVVSALYREALSAEQDGDTERSRALNRLAADAWGHVSRFE